MLAACGNTLLISQYRVCRQVCSLFMAAILLRPSGGEEGFVACARLYFSGYKLARRVEKAMAVSVLDLWLGECTFESSRKRDVADILQKVRGGCV